MKPTAHKNTYIDDMGRSKLSLRLFLKGLQVVLSTGLSVIPEYWDQKNQLVRKGQIDCKETNNKLNALKNHVYEIEREHEVMGIDLTAEELKRQYNEKARRKKKKVAKAILPTTILDYIPIFQKANANLLSSEYLRGFDRIKKRLGEFKPAATFEEFTINEFDSYINYLITEVENTTNTCNKHAKLLRALFKHAEKKGGLTVYPDYADFKHAYVQPKAFYLNWEEVEAIDALNLINRDEQLVRDHFIFRCYTGLRYVDVEKINESNIIKEGENYYIDNTLVKTKINSKLHIPKRALEILQSYGYEFPHSTNKHHNEAIKNIGYLAGIEDEKEKVSYRGSLRVEVRKLKYNMITTHTARRTYARKWINDGGNIEYLSKYLGHSNVKTTWDYLGYEEKKVNDEAKRIFG